MVYVLNKPFAFIYKALMVSMSCGCFQLFEYMMRKHLGMRADICIVEHGFMLVLFSL